MSYNVITHPRVHNLFTLDVSYNVETPWLKNGSYGLLGKRSVQLGMLYLWKNLANIQLDILYVFHNSEIADHTIAHKNALLLKDQGKCKSIY